MQNAFSWLSYCFSTYQKYILYTSHFVTQNIKKKCALKGWYFLKLTASSRTFLSETDILTFQVHGDKEYSY